jgi:hypothetical protein
MTWICPSMSRATWTPSAGISRIMAGP